MNPQNPYQPPQALDVPYGSFSASGADTAVPPPILEAMRQTRPWVIFLAILGFIGTGLMILGGLVVMAMGGFGKLPGAFGLIYVVLALIYVAPSLYLFRYGTGIGRLLERGGIDGLTHALVCQKSFWRLVGIMTLVVIGLYVLIFVGGMAAALIGAFR